MPDQTPFDTLAATYDDDFTHTQVGRWLRGRVHQRLTHHFEPGKSVLEIGCGTGEDAIFLAGQGIRVVATDVSREMLATAQRKISTNLPIQFAKLDLNALPDDRFWGPFDGVFANFGPLNTTRNYAELAAWLAKRLRPGGVAAFAVMSPNCAWEFVWHTLHGDFSTATRRHTPARFQATPGATPLTVYYPPAKQLTHDFSPHFERIHLSGLGLFLPPSDLHQALDKRPRMFHLLATLEKAFAGWTPLAPLADHYWIEFRRAS